MGENQRSNGCQDRGVITAITLLGLKGIPAPFDQRPENEAIDTKGQALIDLCPDGIVLVDKHGEIITSNAAGLRLLGLEGQSLDGQVLGLPLSTGMSVNLAEASGKPIDVNIVERQWNGRPTFLITLRDLEQRLAASEAVAPTDPVHTDEIRTTEAADQKARIN